MAINQSKRGFALLIAVIFMSVMLAFGLSLGSLSYKQQVLALTTVQSQYAFYAADAGLECALYADQQQHLFAYRASPSPAPDMTCDGALPIPPSTITWDATGQMIVTNRVRLDSDKRCADVSVYKPSGVGTTYIFSQGYDVPCSVIISGSAGTRYTTRGINIRY